MPSAVSQCGDADFAISCLFGSTAHQFDADRCRIEIADNGRWSVWIPSRDPESGYLGQTLMGRWDVPSASWVFDSSRDSWSEEMAARQGTMEFRFGPRTPVEPLKRSAFARVDVFMSGGRSVEPQWSLVFDGFEPLPPDDANALLATPRPGAADPIRGVWSLESVRTLGGAQPDDWLLSPTDQLITLGRSWLQQVGWLLAAAIAVAFPAVWLWLRRRHNARRPVERTRDMCRSAPPQIRRSRTTTGSFPGGCRLLVVIAVVALLITMASAALAGARGQARPDKSMAFLRQHATVFTAYTMDWGDQWRAVTRPGPWMGYPARVPYFAASTLWRGP